MGDDGVFGERCREVGDELVTAKVNFRPNGSAEVIARMRTNGPLLRAMLRAEAELLLADADAMAAGSYEERTPEQRRADAFVQVVERLGQAARAW